MRSMRRGIKEMDVILSRYAEAALPGMDAATLDTYEALLSENDQDLLYWVSGRDDPPAALAPLVADIRASVGMTGG
jgi:antitoxin CptB